MENIGLSELLHHSCSISCGYATVELEEEAGLCPMAACDMSVSVGA